MDEPNQDAQTNTVQTDMESQEFGAQHGQDISGHETGSSSPVAEADDPVKNEAAQTEEVRSSAGSESKD